MYASDSILFMHAAISYMNLSLPVWDPFSTKTCQELLWGGGGVLKWKHTNVSYLTTIYVLCVPQKKGGGEIVAVEMISFELYVEK
jgi:hypothetical protein